MKLQSMTALALTLISLAACLNSTKLISIDPTLTYQILPSYQGSLTQNFIDTITVNTTITSLLTFAKSKPFISYSAEFLVILGPNPTLDLVAQRNSSFAN